MKPVLLNPDRAACVNHFDLSQQLFLLVQTRPAERRLLDFVRLFEIHDQPWFPECLRREVVDGLQMIMEVTGAYEPIAPRLREALDRDGAHRVLDLCSGAGGPWPSLVRGFQVQGSEPSGNLSDG